MKNGLSRINNIDLGVDMARLYLGSCRYMQWLPEFFDIYDAYKIEVHTKNLEENVQVFKEYIDGKELPENGARELRLLEEADVYWYLIQKNYSFAAKAVIFNQPVKDVW